MTRYVFIHSKYLHARSLFEARLAPWTAHNPHIIGATDKQQVKPIFGICHFTGSKFSVGGLVGAMSNLKSTIVNKHPNRSSLLTMAQAQQQKAVGMSQYAGVKRKSEQPETPFEKSARQKMEIAARGVADDRARQQLFEDRRTRAKTWCQSAGRLPVQYLRKLVTDVSKTDVTLQQLIRNVDVTKTKKTDLCSALSTAFKAQFDVSPAPLARPLAQIAPEQFRGVFQKPAAVEPPLKTNIDMWLLRTFGVTLDDIAQQQPAAAAARQDQKEAAINKNAKWADEFERQIEVWDEVAALNNETLDSVQVVISLKPGTVASDIVKTRSSTSRLTSLVLEADAGGTIELATVYDDPAQSGRWEADGYEEENVTGEVDALLNRIGAHISSVRVDPIFSSEMLQYDPRRLEGKLFR